MKKLTPKKVIALPYGAKLLPFSKFAQQAGIKFQDSGSLVVYDQAGTPRVFAFDAYSLWDLLCTLDEKLEEVMPSKDYIFKNPVGWLIDTIEGQLPIKPKVLIDIEEAKQELPQ